MNVFELVLTGQDKKCQISRFDISCINFQIYLDILVGFDGSDATVFLQNGFISSFCLKTYDILDSDAKPLHCNFDVLKQEARQVSFLLALEGVLEV